MNGRIVALTIVAVLAVAHLLTWGDGASTQVAAQQSDAVDWSISIGEGDGCSTKGDDTNCTLAADETFTLDVSLNTLPDEITEYRRLDIYVTYTGVSSKDNITVVWPDSANAAPYYAPGEVAFGDVGTGDVGSYSTYTGVFITNGFTCTENGVINLVHGKTDTNVQSYHEGEGATETLTIDCGTAAEAPATTEGPTPAVTSTATEGPTPTVTPTATEGPTPTVTLQADDSSGLNVGVVAGIAAAAAAAILALAGAAWYARRRWRSSP